MHTPTREECIEAFIAAITAAITDYYVQGKDDHDHHHARDGAPVAARG